MLEDNNNICDANVKRELRPSQYQCGIPLKRGARPTAMKFVRTKFIYASKAARIAIQTSLSTEW